jgi:exopolysaccharide production protein ExoY
VEAESFHITNPHVDNAPLEVPTPSRSGVSRAPEHDRRRNRRNRVRFGLQRRAQVTLQRHLLRGIRRFAVLLVADLGSFYVMRALLRAVRDSAVLGDGLAHVLSSASPRGLLNGWQFAAALVIGLLVTGNYGPGDQRRSPRRLFLACALATALPLWMAIWTRGIELVAVQYVLTTCLAWVGLLIERSTLDQVITRLVVPQRATVPTLFVGPAEHCREALRGPAFAGNIEYRVLGFVDVHVPPAADARGHIDDFASVLHESGAEAVVVCGYLSDGRFHDVVDASLAAGCQVFSVPRAIEIAGVQPTLVLRRAQALIELSRPALHGRQLFAKRVLDLVASTTALIVLTPLMAVIAIAVKLESAGPAVFGQRRLGKNAQAFKCYKFRSMRADAEEMLRGDLTLYREYVANNYKLPESRDPRLTRMGRFLRKTSLDELPQLLNVFKGEMSLVGPRPIVPEELDKYGHGAPSFLSLKPGITGEWQVNGRSAVGYPDRVEVELAYVRNWSLGRDVLLILKTIPVVLRRVGAY